VRQHKEGTFEGFTKKYKVNRLMYFEVFTDGRVAARREQQVKKFGRDKKIALIEKENPKWEDLTERTSRAAIGISR
ncbi:MAG TPA: hypothetical protein VM009_06180, partial [Terriglobales bacterium]|nr:hypothetical protein [Terriglobales bacterium]